MKISYIHKNIITNVIFYVFLGIPCIYVIGLILNDIRSIVHKERIAKRLYSRVGLVNQGVPVV
jgi:hypothetical protein